MEESFLFLLLSYALTPTLSQRERAFTYKILAHCGRGSIRELIYWPRPMMTSDMSSTSERVFAKSWTVPSNENNIASAEAVCV